MEQLSALVRSEFFLYMVGGFIAIVIPCEIYFQRQAQKRRKFLTRLLELEKQKTKRMEMEMEKQS
jgi:hypothetical protein